MINAIARKYLTYFNKNRVYITSNAILLFGKQRNILFAACCFLCFLYIYKSLYITEQPCCLLQSHKCLLFHEMFVINVIDEIFFIRILEIHYFVIKYLGMITHFQVIRLQAKNWHKCQNTCLIYYLNLLVYLFYTAFFLVYRDFAFQSIADLSKRYW